MYQFILVNSSDQSGRINARNQDCVTSFNITLTYDVTYYISVYVINNDETLKFIPTKNITLMQSHNLGGKFKFIYYVYLFRILNYIK